jgi:phosphoglycolate phosphatase
LALKASHLFLDLDGTLTDPREGIVRSISHALTVLKRPAPALESLTRFIGPPLAETFRTLLVTNDEALIRSAVHAYRERFASVGIFENLVYPEIPAALNVLANRGFQLYLVTSKPTVYAQRIVEHFGLARFFVRIYGPALDELNENKGSLVRRALVAEKLDAGTVAVIGDRQDDVRAARENGASSVGVTWGYGSREEPEGADHTVSSPSQLVSWLGAV